MIPVPGEPIESYDIGIVNEKTHLYYQTDRSNKSIDIFDVIKNTFVGRVPGFVGFTGNGNTSGGNGVSLVNNADRAVVGRRRQHRQGDRSQGQEDRRHHLDRRQEARQRDRLRSGRPDLHHRQ